MSFAAMSRPLALVTLALVTAATACQSAGLALVRLMPGVTNDPRNRTMRREILSFGSDSYCKELTARGIPLKLRDDSPSMGRFFADHCAAQEMDDGDVFIQFQGQGYSWTQASGRVGFTALAAVRYNPDFLLDDKLMYAYFRPRAVQSTRFDAVMIERQQQAGMIAGLLGGNVQDMTNKMGNQMVSQELGRGFTVLRSDDGAVDFAEGILDKGKKPFHPYQVSGSDKALLVSDWSEIHEQQREFLGPFTVDKDDRALYLTMTLDGTPGVDVMVVPKQQGDVWMQSYVRQASLGPPPNAPLMADVIAIKKEWRRTVPLRQGAYYVVIDHSSFAGSVSPPPTQPGLLGTSDVAAVVRYVAQLGDAP